MSEVSYDRFQIKGDFFNLNRASKNEIRAKIVELEANRNDLDQKRNKLLEFYVSGKEEK